MGSPSGKVPKWAPERFSVATVASGGGTPDLISVLEVLGYDDIYGCRKYVGGATGAPRGRGRTLGGGRAPCLEDSPETPPDVRPTPKIPINT